MSKEKSGGSKDETQGDTNSIPEKSGREQKNSKIEDQDAKQKFYCEPCGKQYKTVMEWETHLSSYDHHHKKRWREMNQMVSGRTKRQRIRKEKKQLDRDFDACAEQIERAKKEEEKLSKSQSNERPTTNILKNEGTGMVFNLKTSHQSFTKVSKQPCPAFADDSDE